MHYSLQNTFHIYYEKLFSHLLKDENSILMKNFKATICNSHSHSHKIKDGELIQSNNGKSVHMCGNIIIKYIKLESDNEIYTILTGINTIKMNQKNITPTVYSVVFDFFTNSMIIKMEKYDLDLYDFLISNNIYNISKSDTEYIFEQIIHLFKTISDLNYLYFDCKLSNFVIDIETKKVCIIDLDSEFCFSDKNFFTYEDKKSTIHIYKIIQKHSMNKSKIYFLVMISLLCSFHVKITKFSYEECPLFYLLNNYKFSEFSKENKNSPENVIIVNEILEKSETIKLLNQSYL